MSGSGVLVRTSSLRRLGRWGGVSVLSSGKVSNRFMISRFRRPRSEMSIPRSTASSRRRVKEGSPAPPGAVVCLMVASVMSYPIRSMTSPSALTMISATPRRRCSRIKSLAANATNPLPFNAAFACCIDSRADRTNSPTEVTPPPGDGTAILITASLKVSETGISIGLCFRVMPLLYPRVVKVGGLGG